MEIKYIDDCLIANDNDDKPIKTNHQLFEEFASLVYNLLAPQKSKSKSKSWKTKLRILQASCSKETY